MSATWSTGIVELSVKLSKAGYIRFVITKSGKIRALNYVAEMSSRLVRLLFPVPVISDILSYTISWLDKNLSLKYS